MAAATLRLPWLTPHRDSADSVACHGLIVAVWCPTATRLAALAVGCRKFAPQALCRVALACPYVSMASRRRYARSVFAVVTEDAAVGVENLALGDEAHVGAVRLDDG